MNEVSVLTEESKSFFKRMDFMLESLFNREQETLEEFLEEIKITNKIGHHIEYVKICNLLKEEDKDFDKNTITYPYCRYAESCTAYINGAAPIGKQCPYELNFVWTTTQELFEQLAIDIDGNSIEKMMIGDYVSFALMKYRAMKTIAHEGLQVTSQEYAKDGINFKTTEHPAVATISKAESMMAHIRKNLVADRESRIKFNLIKQKVETDKNKIDVLKQMNEKSSKVTKENKLKLLEEVEEAEELYLDLDEN